MTVAGSQKGFPIARDHPGYAAGSGRRRPHLGLAPNRIGAADYQHRDSTLPDIKECYKHIKSTPIVRVVVNKVSEKTETSYGYGY